MVDEFDRWREEIEFALKKIVEVAEQRHDNDALAHCRTLMHFLVRTGVVTSNLPSKKRKKQLMERIEFEMFRLAEDLSMVINLELREIVYPLPEIKESTHRFGITFVPSKYMSWLPAENNLSAEEVIGLLERQLDKLHFALDLFRKHRMRGALSRYA
jgi:hypothetical protein